MFNDGSEAEYLYGLEIDNCIIDDECDLTPHDNIYYSRPYIYIGRKKGLNNSIEKLKRININKKKYSQCTCPMCKKTFTKKSYQQKFCSDKCRIKYHNKRKVYI